MQAQECSLCIPNLSSTKLIIALDKFTQHEKINVRKITRMSFEESKFKLFKILFKIINIENTLIERWHRRMPSKYHLICYVWYERTEVCAALFRSRAKIWIYVLFAVTDIKNVWDRIF